MKRTAPVYLLAILIMFAATGLALAATPLEPEAVAAATPAPAATFHYSTVGSCGCEVQSTTTVTPTLDSHLITP
jgi:hypothetical protein